MQDLNIKDVDELKSHLTGKVNVVEFYAKWCGPCRMLTPKLTTLSEEYQQRGHDVKFMKIDIDQCPDISDYFRVTAMPTIKIIEGTKVENAAKTIVGGSFEKVKDGISEIYDNIVKSS